MRWIRGLAALLALIAGIAGAPVLLVWWGRYPAADLSWLLRPDDGRLLLVLLTAVGWLGWAAFTASTVAELGRVLSGNRWRLRIPALGGLQGVSASLLFAVLSMSAWSPAAHAAPAPLPSVGLVRPLDIADATPLPETAVAQSASLGSAEGPAAVPKVPLADPRPVGRYEVVAGDDLWSITARVLGSGSRWRELVAANPDLQADPTRQLVAGTRLVVPESPVEESTAPRRVLVEKGDTLSGLAKEYLGTSGRWPRIQAANRSLIDDPDHIEVGWRLTIPGARAAARTVSASPPHATPQHEDATPSERADTDPAELAPGSDHGRDTSPEAAASASVAAPGAPATSSAPHESAGPSDQADPSDENETDAAQPADLHQVRSLLAGLGALSSAAIIGTLGVRRHLQLRSRPAGRRVAQPTPEAARVRSALRVREHRDPLDTLEWALRRISRHCHDLDSEPARLAELLVSADALEFHWAEPAGSPPLGFSGDSTVWSLPLADQPEAGPPGMDGDPVAYPALVTLGLGEDGASVLVDVERSGLLGVAADTAELRAAALAAMAVELTCSPWAAELSVVVVGADARLTLAAGGDTVRHLANPDDAVTELSALTQRRREALAAERPRRLRIDPERSESVGATIYLFLDVLDPRLQQRLDAVLAGSFVGVSAVVATASQAPAQWQVTGDPFEPQGRLAGAPRTLRAQTIPAATRDAIAGLFDHASDTRTSAAPWWSPDPEAASNVRTLHPRPNALEEAVDIVRLRSQTPPHPCLRMLGPVDLTGAAGPEPTRSRQQLLETCGWLLEHPGRTSVAMSSALLIAEGTRRSNVSRLRSWLGTDSQGNLYLPDAYSGRIALSADVTSDWLRLQLLLGPGANLAPASALIAALELVRGAPLADAAPGQWHWAEELRIDMASAVRDTGLVLVEHALTQSDIDLARWAAARALTAAPEDELLLGARIRTEQQAGNRPEVERLVARLTQQARILGVDLMPETVVLCQSAIEGRPRARRA